MLIIFDLDDTLIDTSGSIIPFKLEDAFFKMVEKGLQIKNQKKELLFLKNLDKKSLSTKETLKKFLKRHCQEKFLKLGVEEVYSDIDKIKILQKKGASKILSELKILHKLALVTVGKENIQIKKLKKAGIDCSFFSIIEVLEERDKKPSYKKILKKLKIHPEKVWVCGDRINLDLKPAKLLKCNTIHMKFGRGLNSRDEENIVDHEIHELKEIKKIISKYGEKI